LSGSAAAYGELSLQGVRDAVANFKEKTGWQVELIAEDTAGDPKIAVSAATKLFNIDKVKYAVVGTSAVTAAVAPLADQYKSLVITDAAGYGLTKDRSYLMQNLMPSLNNIAEKIKEESWLKVAVVYINDEFGVKWAENTKANLVGKTVELFALEKTATDFKTQATKIKQFNPDVIVVIGYGPALNQAHADMQTLGIKAPELTYLSCTLPGVLTDKRFSLEGKYSYEYPQRSDESTFYSIAYENTLAILTAVSKTGGDVDKTISYLKNTGVDGLYGKVKFNEQGVVERDLVLTEIKNGKCQPLN
jgi:branched-chain amino acid transport system substrate-binding protein